MTVSRPSALSALTAPKLARQWTRVGRAWLPFADAAGDDVPLGRLLRLSLFQVSVGMAAVLLTGTLNRVMIVELGIPAAIVALMVALPLLAAPFRALIGFRSDMHRSVLGWRRVPYIWFGSLIQFGGLAIMPFALIILSGDTHGPVPGWVGPFAAGVAFLMVGIGMHTTQTAGLALATDLVPQAKRPRVVALLYLTLLLGMMLAALVVGALLEAFSQGRLIQVIQGAAMVTMVLNMLALWKQEARNPVLTDPARPRPAFREAWAALLQDRRTARLLVAVGLGTAAFAMQDVLLEPYGGQVLALSVAATTALTAFWAGGAVLGFALAARLLGQGLDPLRLAAGGALIGVVAFALVILADPMGSALLFRLGAGLIGLGGGLFGVGTLIAAMSLGEDTDNGLVLGAWGAVQATAMGLAVGLGGGLRDGVASLAAHGALGPALTGPAVGYGAVYLLEIVLLFATLVAIGPLVRSGLGQEHGVCSRFGLAQIPG